MTSEHECLVEDSQLKFLSASLILTSPLVLSGTIILGDPGAVSRAGGKGATKVFKHRRKSPWIPTLTGPFPNGQVNDGSWLGTKNAFYYCAQSRNSISWVVFVSSYTTRQLLTRSRLVWLMHQLMHAVRKLSVWYKHFISKYWLSLH